MALDTQPSSLKARPAPGSTGPAGYRGRDERRRQPVRAAVRRRFDEAALAAAIRELSTHRHTRAPG